MKHRQKTRAEIIAEMKQQKTTRDVILGTRLMMMISFTILFDKYGWTPDDINEFIDDSLEMLDAYNEGRVDMDEWIANIKELIGIDILGEIYREKKDEHSTGEISQ